MADEVRKRVLEKLQLVNVKQLNESCGRLQLIVSENKKGNKRALFNTIMRYLMPEELEDSEDEGMGIFLKLNDELKVMLGEDDDERRVRDEIKLVNVSDVKDKVEVKTESKSRVELHKLREFKITGGVVGGTDNALDYRSLCYQMQEGRSLNYSSKEIVSGVIKAMKAGSSVRRYFEGRIDLTEESMMKSLRSIYNVKDSTTLLDEMVNSSQEPTESEINFVLIMMGFRDNIITLTREEGCPLGDDLVKRRFFHAVSVGLNKDTIRLELQHVLKDVKITDEDLLKEVSQVVARDDENRKKTKTGNAAASNRLNVDTDNLRERMDDFEKSKDNIVIAEIKQLTTKVNELSEMKHEILELKKQLAGKQKREGAGWMNDGRINNRRRGFVKCKKCEENNDFCTHCSLCGSDGHKRSHCTTKND